MVIILCRFKTSMFRIIIGSKSSAIDKIKLARGGIKSQYLIGDAVKSLQHAGQLSVDGLTGRDGRLSDEFGPQIPQSVQTLTPLFHLGKNEALLGIGGVLSFELRLRLLHPCVQCLRLLQGCSFEN